VWERKNDVRLNEGAMEKKKKGSSWEHDQALIHEALEQIEQETRRQVSVIAEVMQSEFGELLLGLIDRWRTHFMEQHVKRDEEEFRLWRGAVICMESFKHSLEETVELNRQHKREEEGVANVSMDEVYNDEGIYSDI
jgi:hypothetical protein